MNNDQNDNPPLSLFDVLVDEYEHQIKTHGLKPLYDYCAPKPGIIAVRLKQSEKLRKKSEELRTESEELRKSLSDGSREQAVAARNQADEMRQRADEMGKRAIEEMREQIKIK